MDKIIQELNEKKERMATVATAYTRGGYVIGANRLYDKIEKLKGIIRGLEELRKDGTV